MSAIAFVIDVVSEPRQVFRVQRRMSAPGPAHGHPPAPFEVQSSKFKVQSFLLVQSFPLPLHSVLPLLGAECTRYAMYSSSRLLQSIRNRSLTRLNSLKGRFSAARWS